MTTIRIVYGENNVNDNMQYQLNSNNLNNATVIHQTERRQRPHYTQVDPNLRPYVSRDRYDQEHYGNAPKCGVNGCQEECWYDEIKERYAVACCRDHARILGVY
jgi:hypothetical protein